MPCLPLPILYTSVIKTFSPPSSSTLYFCHQKKVSQMKFELKFCSACAACHSICVHGMTASRNPGDTFQAQGPCLCHFFKMEKYKIVHQQENDLGGIATISKVETNEIIWCVPNIWEPGFCYSHRKERIGRWKSRRETLGPATRRLTQALCSLGRRLGWGDISIVAFNLAPCGWCEVVHFAAEGCGLRRIIAAVRVHISTWDAS